MFLMIYIGNHWKIFIDGVMVDGWGRYRSKFRHGLPVPTLDQILNLIP